MIDYQMVCHVPEIGMRAGAGVGAAGEVNDWGKISARLEKSLPFATPTIAEPIIMGNGTEPAWAEVKTHRYEIERLRFPWRGPRYGTHLGEFQ